MTIARSDPGTRVTTFPFMERPMVGILLAAIAGMLNAWSLAETGTFATVQSGNLVTAGYSLAMGDWSHVARALASILCFGLGAGVNAIVVTLLIRSGRTYSGPVLFVQAGLILVLGALATAGVAPAMVVALGVSFVAGSQGNAFHRDHGMLYGNIAVTFVVQSFFSLLGRVLVPSSAAGRRVDAQSALIYGGVLIAFAAGAALGFLIDTLFTAGSLWAAAGITLIVGLIAVTRRDPQSVDPAQNAPTP